MIYLLNIWAAASFAHSTGDYILTYEMTASPFNEEPICSEDISQDCSGSKFSSAEWAHQF